MRAVAKSVAFVVPVVMLLAVCRPPEERAMDTALVDTFPAPVTMPTDTPPGTAAAPGARTVHVVLNEWSVSPQERTLDAGNVTFHVMNEGQNQHALTVERGSGQWNSGNIPAGGTGTVTVNLTPGTYTLYCPVVEAGMNHRQRGMQTTITVR